jgi:hypothetical protein
MRLSLTVRGLAHPQDLLLHFGQPSEDLRRASLVAD